jgi:hypothetical protein
MKILNYIAILSLTCPLACFGFVPHNHPPIVLKIVPTRKKTALIQPLQVVSDLKAPTTTYSNEKDITFTIPMDEISLDDIPKVGG